ncbi:allantoate permease [[Candida] anglica]|uniref:Allantoate permease n=1 Tax=[Candida] anglica TaxID=148631 RepID=A0ABP0ECU5_9ASCO
MVSSKDEKDLVQVKSAVREEIGIEDGVVGLDYFEQAQDIGSEDLEAEYKRILRKLDYRILPILCVTYTLQFLDKLSLNYAAAYTLKEDLGLQGQRYSWVAAIFNFGYLAGALPSNYIIQKVPVAKYTGCMLVVWAVLLIGHVGAKNYGGMLVLRFLLGMLESAISPSCMMICGLFYPKDAQPMRMATFLSCNGIATMVGALLGYGLGHAHNSHIKAWQLIFMVIGLLNFTWAFFFLWLCPDSPERAKFLTDREKAVVIEKVSHNNMGIKDKQFKKYQMFESLCDISVWMMAFVGLGCGVVNGGSSNFSSTLIKGFGFSGLNATALQLPTGAFEFVLVFAAGVAAIYIKNTRTIFLALLCVPGLAGLIGIHVISLEHRWALVGCTWLQFIIGGPVIFSWICLNANVAGHSKKAIATGLWFTFYAAGNIVGSNIFYAYQAPKYISGMIGLITSYVGMIVLAISYRYLLVWRNKKRDQEQGGYTEEIARQAVIDGFKDMTDKENRGFRYSL